MCNNFGRTHDLCLFVKAANPREELIADLNVSTENKMRLALRSIIYCVVLGPWPEAVNNSVNHVVSEADQDTLFLTTEHTEHAPRVGFHVCLAVKLIALLLFVQLLDITHTIHAVRDQALPFRVIRKGVIVAIVYQKRIGAKSIPMK